MLLAACGMGGAFNSCTKGGALTEEQDAISAEMLSKISRLGFGAHDIVQVEDGYPVEGDILLTHEMLNETPQQTLLRIAEAEQYRTIKTNAQFASKTSVMINPCCHDAWHFNKYLSVHVKLYAFSDFLFIVFMTPNAGLQYPVCIT